MCFLRTKFESMFALSMMETWEKVLISGCSLQNQSGSYSPAVSLNRSARDNSPLGLDIHIFPWSYSIPFPAIRLLCLWGRIGRCALGPSTGDRGRSEERVEWAQGNRRQGAIAKAKISGREDGLESSDMYSTSLQTRPIINRTHVHIIQYQSPI